MNVGISRAVLDQIMAHVRENPAREVCGLLFGDTEMITEAHPAANISPDPAERFELDPGQLIAAYRAMRGGGPTLIGHYHSHPKGLAMPSAHDAATATPGLLWLIVANDAANLFEVVEGGAIHGCFRLLGLHVDPRRLV